MEPRPGPDFSKSANIYATNSNDNLNWSQIMERITSNVSFYCRESKKNRQGLAPVEMCVVLKKYNFRLPLIGNHKLNVYLKTIRDICGIDKPIFSHVARHTYATRCLNRGIRLEVVARLLGHKTTKLTTHYAKLLEKNIIDEVGSAFGKV